MKTTRIHLLLLFILALGTFIANNALLPADYMESRNLATAQEMVATGNYLIPTMNGELRLEKPPLPTWIAAGVEHIFPGSLAAQRTATGLAGVLLLFFLYGTVLELSQRKNQAFYTGAILATSYSVIMMARNATWDIYCHAFMLMGIYFFIKGCRQTGKQYGYFIGAGIGWGLSFLAKGPVSFYALLLPFLIAFFITYRPSVRGKGVPILIALLLTVALSGAWPLYIMLHEQDTLLAITKKETGAWTGHNVRPWYYYKLFFVEAGIWSLFWLTALGYGLFHPKFKMNRSTRFFLLWTIGSLLLLSVVPEKKTRYLLPLLIPGAANMGAYWEYIMSHHLRKKGDRFWFHLNTGVLLLVFLAIPPLSYFVIYKEGLIDGVFWGFIAGFFLLCAFLLLFALVRKEPRRGLIFSTLIGAMVAVTTLFLIPAKRVFINTDRHSIRELRGVKEWNEYSFYHPESEFLRMELVYESNRIIRPLNTQNLSEVTRHLPFILVSTQPIPEVLPTDSLRITPIGTYDNNWRQPDHKRYNMDLVKEVALIEARN